MAILPLEMSKMEETEFSGWQLRAISTVVTIWGAWYQNFAREVPTEETLKNAWTFVADAVECDVYHTA